MNATEVLAAREELYSLELRRDNTYYESPTAVIQTTNA
jgi:hypothetical protein